MKTKTSEELALICYHRPDTVWAIPMRNSWEHEGMLFDQSDWGYLLDEHGHAATRYNYDDLLELFEDYEGETQILVAVVKYTTTVDARGPVDDHVLIQDIIPLEKADLDHAVEVAKQCALARRKQ